MDILLDKTTQDLGPWYSLGVDPSQDSRSLNEGFLVGIRDPKHVSCWWSLESGEGATLKGILRFSILMFLCFFFTFVSFE